MLITWNQVFIRTILLTQSTGQQFYKLLLILKQTTQLNLVLIILLKLLRKLCILLRKLLQISIFDIILLLLRNWLICWLSLLGLWFMKHYSNFGLLILILILIRFLNLRHLWYLFCLVYTVYATPVVALQRLPTYTLVILYQTSGVRCCIIINWLRLNNLKRSLSFSFWWFYNFFLFIDLAHFRF